MTRTGTRRQGRRPRKRLPKRDASPEADRSDLRALCRALGFWRVCGKPSCRRALDCKGDAEVCFRTFWWQMPEQTRVWVRAAIRASAGGMGNKAAGLAADAEVARWHEVQMRYAPRPASPEPIEHPEAPKRIAPMPRIRML